MVTSAAIHSRDKHKLTGVHGLHGVGGVVGQFVAELHDGLVVRLGDALRGVLRQWVREDGV
jgi:hypothetical protein